MVQAKDAGKLMKKCVVNRLKTRVSKRDKLIREGIWKIPVFRQEYSDADKVRIKYIS